MWSQRIVVALGANGASVTGAGEGQRGVSSGTPLVLGAPVRVVQRNEAVLGNFVEKEKGKVEAAKARPSKQN